MVQSIDNHLTRQFADFVHMDAQQNKSRLRAMGFRLKQLSADDFAYEGLGTVDMEEVTSRLTPATFHDIEHKRRQLKRRRFFINLPIDASDVRGMLLNPNGMYVEAARKGSNRQFDRVGVESSFADVKTGREFGTTVGFAADGVLDVDATAGYTYEKLLEIKENYMNNEVGMDEDEKVVILQTGKEHTSLMKETELTSGDFSRQFVVDRGEIVRAVGMDLIHYGANVPRPMLEVTAGGERRNIVTTTRGLCFGISKDMTIKVQDRTDFIETTQVQIVIEVGCVRTEGVQLQRLLTTA